MTNSLYPSLRRFGSLPVFGLALALVFFLAACDTADPVQADQVTFQGTVTDAEGFGAEGDWRGVQGATVTAYTIGQDGQLQQLPGQVTTDADGRYTFTTDATDRPVRLQATPAGGTQAQHATVIEAGGAMTGNVAAAPMTAESTVQADVYGRGLVSDPHFSIADVHAHVGEGTAAAVRSGAATVDQVTESVRSGAEAERAFAMHTAGGGITADAADQARTARDRAFTDFRTQAAAATSFDARRQAQDTFFDSYARGYDDAGLTATQQAHAATAGGAASTRFAGTTDEDALFGMAERQRALGAISSTRAVEDEFRTAGASEAHMGALGQARGAYQDALRGATTQQQVDDAWGAYRGAVSTELAAHGGFTTGQIDGAFRATDAARAQLDAGVQGATGAQGVADAHGAFYPAATQAAHTSLGGAQGQQSLGGNVVGTMSGF